MRQICADVRRSCGGRRLRVAAILDALIFKVYFAVYEFSLGSPEEIGNNLSNNLSKRTWRKWIISIT